MTITEFIWTFNSWWGEGGTGEAVIRSQLESRAGVYLKFSEWTYVLIHLSLKTPHCVKNSTLFFICLGVLKDIRSRVLHSFFYPPANKTSKWCGGSHPNAQPRRYRCGSLASKPLVFRPWTHQVYSYFRAFELSAPSPKGLFPKISGRLALSYLPASAHCHLFWCIFSGLPL